MKDILTPYLGGTNHFFAISNDQYKNTLENMIAHLNTYQFNDDQIKASLFEKLSLQPIENWQDNLIELIKVWTCDLDLESIRGRKGCSLSDYLVRFLLKDFFKNQPVAVYKLLPNWGNWPWADHMSENFLFETEEKIYIMHFGESS